MKKQIDSSTNNTQRERHHHQRQSLEPSGALKTFLQTETRIDRKADAHAHASGVEVRIIEQSAGAAAFVLGEGLAPVASWARQSD